MYVSQQSIIGRTKFLRYVMVFLQSIHCIKVCFSITRHALLNLQARNNARVLISGSLELFSNRYFDDARFFLNLLSSYMLV